MSEPLLAFPDPLPPYLADALRRSTWDVHVVGSAEEAVKSAPDEGWPGAIVATADDADAAFAVCRSLRRGEERVEPVLLVVRRGELPTLELREELFADLICMPLAAD